MNILRNKLIDYVDFDELNRDKKDGSFIFRREFFYRHGFDANKFAERISAGLTKLGLKHQIIDQGTQDYIPFRGGASVKNQNHWWVKVKIVDPNKDIKEFVNEMDDVPLMTQKFDSEPKFGDELLDPRMKMMSENYIEVHGTVGPNNKPWVRKFKSEKDFDDWFEKTKDNVRVTKFRRFDMNESNAFKDWSPRGIDDISPTAEALNRAVKMLRSGQKIEDIAGNLGMPVERLRALLQSHLAKASPVVNKQDRRAAMASKYGVNESDESELLRLKKLAGLK